MRHDAAGGEWELRGKVGFLEVSHFDLTDLTSPKICLVKMSNFKIFEELVSLLEPPNPSIISNRDPCSTNRPPESLLRTRLDDVAVSHWLCLIAD